ncbi:MAG: hypothetical protein KDE27_22240 [Planctomycetes bacterium]|nr:hypothetical protein [Planctomycetota bacterium]
MSSRPTTFLRLLLAAAVPCACTAMLRADEVRLDDGRVLVGKVVHKTADQVYEVETRDGLVVVPEAKVLQIRTDAELRVKLAEAKESSGDTPFSFLQLAIDARSYGLEPEMWRYLEIAIQKQNRLEEQQQANDALSRRITEFLARLEPEIMPLRWRSADTSTRVHQLVQQVRLTNKLARELAIRELLAREANADAALRREARRNTLPYRRVAALEALAQRARNEQARGQDQQFRFVLRTMILDGDEDVRNAAARIAREHGQVTEEAIHYLAGGLVHQLGKVRVRTAEAFANLGHPAAIADLVAAGPSAGAGLAAAGGTGTRAHIAIVSQQAYIRDFDVEVAQAAFIADPKVDVLQSGTVLDVTVAGVFEERTIARAYRRALKQLAGADPGADPMRWRNWLAQREASAAKPAATDGR